jgi:DNA-binding transcriptional LysR family regulator
MMFRDSSLLYFYTVAQTGSIRQAAEKLRISSSAISRMVAKAESDFEAVLFERRADGMRLTPAGQILSDQLSSIFSQLEGVKERIAELQGLREGHVTLACIEGVIEELAPGFLTDFHRDYPGIKSTVASAGPDQIIAAMQADSADIGIFFGSPKQPSVHVLLSYDEAMYAIVSPSHPLAGRSQTSLNEISTLRVAMPDPSFGARRILDGALSKLGISIPMLLTTNSIDLTLRMASTGDTLTVLPRFSIRRKLQSGQLLAVPLAEHQLLTGTLMVCKRPDRMLSAPALRLLEYIQASFAIFSSSEYADESAARPGRTVAKGDGERSPAQPSEGGPAPVPAQQTGATR